MGFVEAAYLDKKHDPWLIRRKPGLEFVEVEIVSCQQSNWWYADHIGEQVMCEIRWRRGNGWKQIADLKCVAFSGNVRIHSGRGLDPKDVIIL